MDARYLGVPAIVLLLVLVGIATMFAPPATGPTTDDITLPGVDPDDLPDANPDGSYDRPLMK